MEQAEKDATKRDFELEEYRQVLEERRFVMTRYMQAVGLYLALAGFAGKELLDARSPGRLWLLAVLLSSLNLMGVWAARRFRSMAERAMLRESYFVEHYGVQQMHLLFWGYWGGLILVLLDQLVLVCIVAWRLGFPASTWPT